MAFTFKGDHKLWYPRGGQMKTLIPVGVIEQRILLIRGQKVILDADLVILYSVPTRVLNQAVRRNLKRFPQDFMFKLSQPERIK